MSTPTANEKQLNHRWRFFRSGGLDQVRLETRADLENLHQLDPKLWAALSCPTRGLEFDSKTLDFIDSDSDGRIRVPEILAAVRWACTMLKNPDDLVKPGSTLRLDAINDSHTEGKQLLASARQILVNLGKADATELGTDDTADTARIFAHTLYNGDGIVPAAACDDPALRKTLEDILSCVGGGLDRSGDPGVTEASVKQFFDGARALVSWADAGAQDAAHILPLGDNTAGAAAALAAVRAKADDYFARCRLAAFDARATGALNRAEREYEALAPKLFSANAAEVADFPLAHVEADRPLPLTGAVNPAWAGAISAFRTAVVTPLLGTTDRLTDAEWTALCAKFDAYSAWNANKPDTPVAMLALPRVREILGGNAEAALADLIARDMTLEPEADAIVSVDKLLHLRRDLLMLLNNFVALRDFYSGKTKAIFQAGTLYLDGRSCELCIRVDDVGKHGAVASLSRTFLAYCDCQRRGATEKMTIAAAFTAGDSDQLMTGRNGVFFDRLGRDWDATIIKLVEHPISIRQAFLSPYKRIGRMIGEQIEKMAVSRDKAIQDRAAVGIGETAKHVETGKPPAQQAFDVGKFAGIFAAIGLALGAIGTAIASVVTGIMGLAWWQMPLAFAGLILVVSGPSMLIAALKLRQRNLGPLLDANGWAVNTRAKINIEFGGALTRLAKLPPGAERSKEDPFAEKSTPWGFYLFLLAVAIAVLVLWQQGYLGQWLSGTAVVEPPASP